MLDLLARTARAYSKMRECNPIMSSKHGVCVIVPKSIFVSRRRTDHSELRCGGILFPLQSHHCSRRRSKKEIAFFDRQPV